MEHLTHGRFQFMSTNFSGIAKLPSHYSITELSLYCPYAVTATTVPTSLQIRMPKRQGLHLESFDDSPNGCTKPLVQKTLCTERHLSNTCSLSSNCPSPVRNHLVYPLLLRLSFRLSCPRWPPPPRMDVKLPEMLSLEL